MTSSEAIKMIKDAEKCGSKGFAVICMEDEDIETYGDGELKEKYGKLTDEQKIRFCGKMMDEVYDVFEEGVDYGFGRIFRDALRFAEDDGKLDEMME